MIVAEKLLDFRTHSINDGVEYTQRWRRLQDTINANEYTSSHVDLLFDYSLGVRASGNGWEHVRNIERTGSIYLTCFH